MSGALEFDVAAAGATARSWSTWGDHLHHARYAFALELDRLQLGGIGAATGGHLGAAAEHLWTVAAFTQRVRIDVFRADGRLSLGPRRLAGVMDHVAATIARRAGGREAEGRRWAALERLRHASGADVRRHFEGVGTAADPVEVLAGLSGDEAVLYWNALTDDEHRSLASTRPDLVVLHVLAGGAMLSTELLALLDASNAFGAFASALGFDVDVSVGLKVLQLDLGGDVEVTLTELSDGTVEMLLREAARAGAGQDVSVPGAASGSWAVGGAVDFQQKFAFDDVTQAATAIATLQAAVAHDVSFGAIATDLGTGSINHLVGVINAQGSLWNLTNHVPILERLPDAPVLPTFDLTPEVARELQRLWDDHGLEHVEALGSYGVADAEFVAAVAELSASATAHTMFYDQDARAGSSGRGRTGMVVSGVIELDGDTDQHVTGAARFAADVHHVDGERLEMTLLLSGQIATGTTAQVFELEAAAISADRDQALAGTIEMVVPIDDASEIASLVMSLGAGRLPVDDIRRLYDRSEISVRLQRGDRTTTSIELDGGLIAIDATAESYDSTTVVALRKFPGGDMYDQIDVDRVIDRAR